MLEQIRPHSDTASRPIVGRHGLTVHELNAYAHIVNTRHWRGAVPTCGGETR